MTSCNDPRISFDEDGDYLSIARSHRLNLPILDHVETEDNVSKPVAFVHDNHFESSRRPGKHGGLVVYLEADPWDRIESEVRSYDQYHGGSVSAAFVDGALYGCRRPIRVSEEVHTIREACNLGGASLDVYLNVRKVEIPKILDRQILEVVHFSGHGSEANGLLVCKENGSGRLVEHLPLKDFLECFKDEAVPGLLILAACHTARWAKEIVEKGRASVVIGVNGRVEESSVANFVERFYRAFMRKPRAQGKDFLFNVNEAFSYAIQGDVNARDHVMIFPNVQNQLNKVYSTGKSQRPLDYDVLPTSNDVSGNAAVKENASDVDMWIRNINKTLEESGYDGE